MTHDPLCHVTWMDSSVCAQCRLIARVREDERGKFIQVDTTYMPAEQYDAMMKALEGEA